jgi:cytochrome P450
MTPGIPAMLLLDPNVIDDPYPFYRRLRGEAPVWEIPRAGLFTLSTFELLAEATRRVDDFSSNLTCLLYRDDAGIPCRLPFGDAGGQALATADPPAHPLHRSTVFPELVAKRMNELERDVVAIADQCVTRALHGGTVEFMSEIGNVVPITMISRLIGFHDGNTDQLLRAAFDSTAMLGSTLTLDELMQLIGRVDEVQTWIADQLANAMREPNDDLLGAVARGVQSDVFGEFEANGILHTLLSAGGESTTSLLGNAVRMLAEHSDLRSATTCGRCTRTPPSAASRFQGVPRSYCSGVLPIATTPSSNVPMRSISNGRCRATCRSGAASITVSVRPLRVSRLGTCSRFCSIAPAASHSIPTTRRGGSIA